jgi:hypothetical protein
VITDTERAASELITFYASLLHDAVGDGFCQAHLSQAVAFWFDSSGTYSTVILSRDARCLASSHCGGTAELQQSARLLFGCLLDRMSTEEVGQVVKEQACERKYTDEVWRRKRLKVMFQLHGLVTRLWRSSS